MHGKVRFDNCPSGEIDTKGRQCNLSFLFNPCSSFSAMGVSAEPGQKGVNWSNIAVGEQSHYHNSRVVNDLLVPGGIMNMVRHQNSVGLTTHLHIASV